MKHNIKYIVLAFAAAALLSGCSTDPQDTETGRGNGNSNKLTFLLPGVSSGTTVYGPVGSEQGEDDLDHLDIYMFDATKKTLEVIFWNDEISLNTSGQNPVATIDVTERVGAKVLFFVGNSTGLASELSKVRYGETTIDQFRGIISDPLDTLPVKPLLMTAEVSIADIENVTDTEKQIKLKRRVARFDIHNVAVDENDPDNIDGTNFVIKRILISSVNKQGYLFDDATRTHAAMQTVTIPPIDFSTVTNANKGKTPAVFYTYPTALGDGMTVISLEGEFFGKTRIYTIAPDSVGIEANKCYVIKAKKIDSNNIVWEVTPDPWGDGSTEELKPNAHKVEVLDFQKSSGDGVFNGTNLDLTAVNGTNEFTFTAKSALKDGTKVDVTYYSSDATVAPVNVTKGESVITYATHYQQPYTITIPEHISSVKVNILVELVSIKDLRERETLLNITSLPNRYPGTTHKPVKVSGTWWAPVNVGAKNINGTVNNVDNQGYLYQWGRDYPIVYDASGDEMEGPITPEVAGWEEYKNKFIMDPRATTGYSTFDWLEPQADGLWSENNHRGPCPEGWRIPTEAQLQKFIDFKNANNGSFNVANGMVEIKGDNNRTLYLPFSGCRTFTDGVSGSFGVEGCYWSSTESVASVNNNSKATRRLYVKPDKTIGFYDGSRGNAFSVRCVLDE